MKKRSGQLWVGILLIILGILYLLKNFGFIGESVWSIVGKLWPLILVLIGLEMIIKDKVLRGVIAIIFLLLFLLFAIFPPKGVKRSGKFGRDIVKRDAVFDSASTFVLNEDLKGVEKVEVKVERLKRLDISVREATHGRLESEMYIRGKRGEFFPDSIEYTFSKYGNRGVLTIRDKRNVKEVGEGLFILRGYEGNLNIKIPKGVSLEIDNINGDVAIESLTLKDVEIKLVNGDLEIDELNFNTFGLTLVNGDFDGDGLVAQDIVELSFVNGDFKLGEAKGKVLKISGVNGKIVLSEDVAFEKVNVEAVNGDVLCTISPKWLKGIVELETVSGDIELQRAGIDRLPVRIKKGLREEGEDPDRARIFVETVSGRVRIK